MIRKYFKKVDNLAPDIKNNEINKQRNEIKFMTIKNKCSDDKSDKEISSNSLNKAILNYKNKINRSFCCNKKVSFDKYSEEIINKPTNLISKSHLNEKQRLTINLLKDPQNLNKSYKASNEVKNILGKSQIFKKLKLSDFLISKAIFTKNKLMKFYKHSTRGSIPLLENLHFKPSFLLLTLNLYRKRQESKSLKFKYILNNKIYLKSFNFGKYGKYNRQKKNESSNSQYFEIMKKLKNNSNEMSNIVNSISTQNNSFKTISHYKLHLRKVHFH